MPVDPLQQQLQTALGTAYTLERELGGGGMSRVFVAEEAALGRRVVVKVLPPELAPELSAERFAREIRLAARLQHPNIVPVLSAGAADGVPYYVMPYVDGDALRAQLRAGPPSLGEAASILRDVAKALAHAHRQGVVHRDVKPENVLLTDGTALVTDFGVAKAVSASTTRTDAPGAAALTRLGATVGTPAYMAPEQAAGDPDVDHRADLYAWGLLAYELLAGRHPFAGKRSAQALAVAHLTEAPEPLAACAPGVPPALAHLVMRCLAKDPAGRPADAAVLIPVLDGALAAAGRGGPADATASPTPGEPAARPAVAVLPFANLSSDPENEYLSDGLTDEIIGTLGRVRAVRVAGRASCFALKGQALAPREVAERLGVTAVVEGSVRRAGNRVRVQAELVNAADGFQLWGERYDRELTDIFAVQEEIAQAIAGALSARLTSTGGGERASRPAPASPEAYRLYLQGVHALNNDLTTAGVERALRLLERALALDPRLGRAQTAVARAYSNFAVYSLRAPHEVMPRARDAARAALAVDERDAEAHAFVAQTAYAYAWDRAAAERSFARALALEPDDPVVLVRTALFRAGAGHGAEDVVPLLRRGVENDPLSPWVRFVAGRTLHLLRRYDEAADVLRDALELNPHHAYALSTLGCVHMARGELDAALDALERASALSGRGPWMVAPLCQLHVVRGERERAERYAAELLRRRSGEYVSGVLCACALAALDRMDDAIHELERAVEERDFWFPMLGVDPLADVLRRDPRFAAMLRPVGVPRS